MQAKLYTLDLTGVSSGEELHNRLAETLALPEWYGNNMDALHDCLTALTGRIIVRGTAGAKKDLPDVYQIFRRVCADSMDENPNLWVYFIEQEPIVRD